MVKKTLTVRPFFSSDKIAAIKEHNHEDKQCLECGLFRFAKSPKMPVTGEGKLKVLIIAEAPGKTEDEQNTQLVGDAGDFLRKKLDERGFDLDRDFWKTNAVCCRPYTKKGNTEKNRAPKPKELQLCKSRYMDFIKEHKPDFIWLMGKSAIMSFYKDRFTVSTDDKEESTDLSPSRWRALCIPDAAVNAWVIPIFHPSYAMRNEYDDLTISQYDRDLDFAIACLKKPPPTFFDPFSKVTIIKDFETAKKLLTSILKDPPEVFAFDYETTGLKPFNKGHKIAAVSYCDDEEMAYAFPLQHPIFDAAQQKEIIDLWCDILQNDSKKVGHNAKFEDVWSQRILGVPVNNWEACTMNNAHIIDNRGSFSGLKFQAFIRWGIEDYDRSMRPYLKTRRDVEFNKVFNAPLDSLLMYNGIDSLLTLRLYNEQMREMTEKEREASQFFREGLIALADIQMNGIPANRSYYEKTDKVLEDRIVGVIKELLSSSEAKKFKEVTGREISLTSDFDLRELFYDILKLESTKETEGGLKSVDAEALTSLNSDFARKLMEFSKLEKIKGTYIGQFLREIDEEGKIRPFFDLHKADTYRSACTQPNFQNIPVRDEEAKQYTRSGIFPSPGNKILGFDYKALEVSIAACISQDPVLIDYCADPSRDMHRDQAVKICKLPAERVSEKIRFYAKNGFVFPEIYGSYYRSCAQSLWDIFNKEHIETADGQFIIEHLLDEHILFSADDYAGFESHLKTVEAEFWARFPNLRQWQENTWSFYKRHGYVQLATGFVCQGYMTRNKLANSPIQGPAFHCLLYSLINAHNFLINEGMKSKIIGQIHDNLIFDCDPREEKRIIEVTTEIATKKIRQAWPWIIVPLFVAWEGTEIDQPWVTQRKLKK